jgi:hypothetical protein
MKSPIDLSAGTLGSCVGLVVLLAFGQPGTPARAADHSDAPAARRSSGFTFSLLPKSLQRRPSLDFHVVTELTIEGRKLAPPTSAEPVYYIAQPGKFTQMGNNNPAGETPPNIERLTRAMEAALASSNYLKASPTTPLPAIAVVFNYGSFARFSMQFYDLQDDQKLAQLADQMNDLAQNGSGEGGMVYSGPMLRSEERDTDALLPIVLSHQMERDDILRRAALIGGEKFARDLAKALTEEAAYRTGSDNVREVGLSLSQAATPFHLFMNANENLMMLVEDSFSGCYFVMASAFDYTAMRKGQRVLLWRTKMTVNSSGISMSESLPALVLAAGPYLGKEMPDAVTLTRKILRGGNVEIGEMRVIETNVPLPGVTTPAAKPPKDSQKGQTGDIDR